MATKVHSQEMSSFCFERNVSLQEARQSLSILLLPKDVVALRSVDNCLDIITSGTRAALFLKYLSKRYQLIKESGAENQNFDQNKPETDCRLELKTTKKMKNESFKAGIGEKNNLNKAMSKTDSESTMEMLLGAGYPGMIEVGDEKLSLLCRLTSAGSAQLTFSYVDKFKASATSEVQVQRGVWLNIASIKKDLADKSHTIGIPQTEMNQSSGESVTLYELRLK